MTRAHARLEPVGHRAPVAGATPERRESRARGHRRGPSDPDGRTAAHDGASRATRPLRIAFLVRCLELGGAERQLVVLASGLRARGHDVSVLVFYPGGPLERQLVEGGVRVRNLHKRGRWDVARFLRDLVRAIRNERPDVLHGYLEVPNVFVAMLRPLFPGVGIVWGLRASAIDSRHYDWTAGLMGHLTAAFGRFAHLLIVNSRAGEAHARRRGHPAARLRVIPNGIDTGHFTRDVEGRRELRRAWGVDDGAPLVGLVARIDPAKDHATFLAAAARLVHDHADVRFVCVGDGDPVLRTRLQATARELGLDDRLRWVPAESRMPAVYSALDVACSSSISEGFPNVVAEAMACGVPCVVTDVGDSAWIVDDPALVAPAGDAAVLADRLAHALAVVARDPATVGARARASIVRRYSVARLVETTESALVALAGGGAS